MVKFIEFEANEIEKNIDTQSEDEYNIKKNEIILKGKMKINQLYNKKTKLMKRTTATMITTLMTNAKLEILNVRDKFIKSVLANVNKELLKLRNHESYYREILKKLILQAMYKVLEKKISLILISDDVECVNSMIPELKQIYLADTGINAEINIDNNIKLPTQEIGGVIVAAKGQRLLIENTLVVRLLYLTQQAIPIICTGLFGPNPTRTYLRDNYKIRN
ncbi:V-type proton ATPase subunit E-like [Melanaphis sacchari]|uniref:V-type proton ATPase subunit E-like n=1 Tax=Melanaphis sacchari TaxID=742174 RepID=UPI000DC132E4|nr:V-type proton ATPase subunit E-like [Melanaphis sacchari]